MAQSVAISDDSEVWQMASAILGKITTKEFLPPRELPKDDVQLAWTGLHRLVH
jgi:hypothetical protein